MNKNTTNTTENQNLGFHDVLTEVLRAGAQQMLKAAIEIEINTFIEQYKDNVTESGLQQIVRNGYLPARTIQTGIGDIAVEVPRTRDRGGEGITFHSALLPPYLKRTKQMDELIPWLYLKGISTGNMHEALESLLGSEAKGLSPTNVIRLKTQWEQDFEAFNKRDLSDKQYVYFWVDGIYLEARLEEKQCMLVIIGVTADGRKELVALSGGFRESEVSWKGVLLDLKNRGLAIGPKLAIGDGALGFWKALKQVYGETKTQRCWVHKTVNVLDKLPQKNQKKAKEKLHEIWMAETKEDALKAFDVFVKTYEDKYPKATDCLIKDKDILLTFYDFPAQHWRHIRTSNAIESTFATVRLRTNTTKGCMTLKTGEVMMFKLIQSAEKRWLRIVGSNHLADVIEGINFKDGVKNGTAKLTENSEKIGDQKCAA
jgi:transposase-like protein